MKFAWLFIGLAFTGCFGSETDSETPAESTMWLHRNATQLNASDLSPDMLSLLEWNVTWLSVDGRDGREPTMAVDSEGTLYYAARDYSGGNTPPVSATQTPIMKSTDGGLTWKDVSPRLPTGDREPPRSGDPMVIADPWTDRIFQIELYDLVCNWVVFSDDQGGSWTGNPKGCGSLVVDHQTIAAGPSVLTPTVAYENMVYVCVNQIADSHCARSLNGGLTFDTFTVVFPGAGPGGVCGGIHGHALVDPSGVVYLPREYCGQPYVGISRDDGITWEIMHVAPGMGAWNGDPNMAFDGAGNVYYAWTGSDQAIWMVHSDDHGQSWSDPVQISDPRLTFANHVSITAAAKVASASSTLAATPPKLMNSLRGTITWPSVTTQQVTPPSPPSR